jgi:hypothetical protein
MSEEDLRRQSSRNNFEGGNDIDNESIKSVDLSEEMDMEKSKGLK